MRKILLKNKEMKSSEFKTVVTSEGRQGVCVCVCVCMNHEFPDVQAGFRKGRGTRDQIANIHRITEKARQFQKNIYSRVPAMSGYCKVYGLMGSVTSERPSKPIFP